MLCMHISWPREVSIGVSAFDEILYSACTNSRFSKPFSAQRYSTRIFNELERERSRIKYCISNAPAHINGDATTRRVHLTLYAVSVPLRSRIKTRNTHTGPDLFTRRSGEIVICPCHCWREAPPGTRASIFIQRPISNRRDKFRLNLRSTIIFPVLLRASHGRK